VALHCVGWCCLFVSVFVMTCCASGVFSVVEHLLFSFRVCLNGGCGLTGANSRWNCAGGE